MIRTRLQHVLSALLFAFGLSGALAAQLNLPQPNPHPGARPGGQIVIPAGSKPTPMSLATACSILSNHCMPKVDVNACGGYLKHCLAVQLGAGQPSKAQVCAVVEDRCSSEDATGCSSWIESCQ